MIVLSCLFCTFQFGMPVIGYFIGTAFKEYIEDAIPWIAFGLLTLLAIKSLVEWIKDFRKIKKEGCQVCKEAETPKKIGPGTAIVQAIATSIDALAVGVAFAAFDSFLKGDTCSSKELLPMYLRLPQAERELNAKRGK